MCVKLRGHALQEAHSVILKIVSLQFLPMYYYINLAVCIGNVM